jgi:4-hydroxy-2-oxoheptanedioate aldolase
MRKNVIREALVRGESVLNGWLAIPSTLPAELMAGQGWDSVCIDMQHGLVDYTDAVPMLQAISTKDVTPLVRVPGNDAAIIGKVLDAGAFGIICPMINTAEEARAFVSACRYPPLGKRSVGPIRASLYGGSDYFDKANDTILTLAMVETDEAVRNIDEILATPGLDGIFVGPSDLSVSMGHKPGFDPRFPDVYDTIKRLPAIVKKHKRIAGIHVGSVQYHKEMLDAGYTFITYLSDFRMLQWCTKLAVDAVRAGRTDMGAP